MKVGIDLGGSHIAIGVVDDKFSIIEKNELSWKDLKQEKNIKNITTYIIENIKELTRKYNITNIGISVPGTISKGIIIQSVNLEITEPYNIKKEIEDNLNISTNIRNDAKCAAIAEKQIGSLKNSNNILFLTLGTGIGGAVIIDGKLLEPNKFPGCEFGHMIIEKDGKVCNCGKKGCFETYASMKTLKNNLREVLSLSQETRGQELYNIIKENNISNKNYEIIENVVNEFIHNLAIGISNLINIFEPEVVGIGGSFTFFEDVLLDKLKKEIQESNLLFNKRTELKIFPAILKNDAGIIGALL